MLDERQLSHNNDIDGPDSAVEFTPLSGVTMLCCMRHSDLLSLVHSTSYFKKGKA
jgi:hypothetical protein